MSENLSHLRQSSWHFCGLIMSVLISQFDFREATAPSTASILIPGTSNPSERCYNKQKKRSVRWYKTLQAFNTLDTSNCHPTGGLPDILNPAAIPAGLPAAEWWYHHCHQTQWSDRVWNKSGQEGGRGGFVWVSFSLDPYRRPRLAGALWRHIYHVWTGRGRAIREKTRTSSSVGA